MTFLNTQVSKSACALILVAALTLLALLAGCTQQAAAPGPVTAQKTDPSHITVAFRGGQGTDTLVELEITVTDSNGKTIIRSLGSRLGTTPVQVNGSATFTGSFSGTAHVVATGYFSNGTQKVMLDTNL